MRIRFEFKRPIVLMAAPDRATVLQGAYVGIAAAGDPEIFDLHEMSADGDPVGPVLGQMRCEIVDAD